MASEKRAEFRWRPISRKQRKILEWWCNGSPYKDYDGIIADGAIRSGKTVSMGFSFVVWAMETFDDEMFGMCGKTISALRRNVIITLKKQLRSRGYAVEEKRAENYLEITHRGKKNTFYLFGGKDESSQDLIQGVTLAGVFFDEVALMPESFVNQATARCSVDGSKFWFNCNPAGPQHWFYINWILRCREKNLVYLHFTMEDNLTLSERVRKRYSGQYVGVFYDRYILGLWVAVEGIIYRMFSEKRHTTDVDPETEGPYYVASDYGIYNDNVFQLWRKIKKSEEKENNKSPDRYYCFWEERFSSRNSQTEKDINDLADDLVNRLGTIQVKCVILDPSASAMKIALKKRGLKVRNADNDVLGGISDVQVMLTADRLLYNYDNCKGTIKEYSLYSWDPKKADKGKDEPIKQHDHGMDATRYFVKTLKLVKRDKTMVPQGSDSYLL